MKRQLQYLSVLLIITLFNISARAQAPNISYTPSTSRLTTNVAIASLTPANTGGAVTPSGYGTATNFVSINSPYDVGSDAAGNLYVVDESDDRLYKVTPGGASSILLSSAKGLSAPVGVNIDGNGNIYVSNNGTNRVLKFNSAGTLLNTISGFNQPYGIAIDASNNAYVANLGTNTIIKIDATTAGTSNAFPSLTFVNPYGITIDPSGNTFVSQYTGIGGNSIVKITPAIVKTTFANTGLNGPRQMGSDAAGNIYVANYGNNNIIKYTPAGTPTTILTGLSTPRSVTTDASYNVYAADYGNDRIKKLPPVNYSISPALPAGLSFNVITGIISGTPTTGFATTTFTISAQNASGTSTTTVTLSCGVTKRWDGSSNSTWTTNANWTPTGAPDDGDDIELGTGTFSSQPIYVGTTNVYNSITFGTFNASVNPKVPITLKIGTNAQNRTLTVTDNITVQSGANVSIASGGSGASVETLVMQPGSSLNINGTGKLTLTIDALTLQSDATGSASIGPVTPTNFIVTGVTANVERYMQGGSLGERGFRLMSSPVSASTTPGYAVYSINYIKNDSFLTGSGGTGGGFDLASNPTLYLYRENIVGTNTSFFTGNFRGIKNINQSPAYSYLVDLDGGGTTKYNIPVGNGFLFFFRGDRTTVNPFVITTVPNSATLSASGTLNVGPFTFRSWYTPTITNLLFTNTFPSASGFNAMGNPYACSIDWDNFTTTNNGNGIYGAFLQGTATGNATMYVLDPITKTYGSYTSGSGVGSQSFATNIIASGQGFFVRATSASATLIFNESAKSVTAQNTGASLLMSKHAVAAAQPQYLRLQLSKDSVNSEQTTIRFVGQGATNTSIFNVLHLEGSGGTSLASLSASNENLGINTTKLPGNQSTVIKLNINATTTGTYQLKLRDLVAIPKLYDIWLMDAYKKDSLNLRTGIYSLDINKADSASFGSGRLSLVIRLNADLAYHLLDFTAGKIQNTRRVQVLWKTENEENYTNFTVERSTDNGRKFEVLGSVKANGSGSYSFTDKDPDNRRNFYRLKQQNLNNAISYSKIAEVQFFNHGDDKLHIYPNPATHVINLDLNAKTDGREQYDIQVSNCYGFIVRQATSSQTDWQTNISNLRPGTYLVRVLGKRDRNLIGQAKFVKL